MSMASLIPEAASLVEALSAEQAAEAKEDLKRVRAALRQPARPRPETPWNLWTYPRIGPMEPSLSNPKPDELESWLKSQAKLALERKQAPRGWR